ncbi:helix-turn-helix domain-containing protein [Salinirubrum litoreum]|uniref:Helix-turn-helix domain-containing protein n=1 Tax=Salinirubrum litoreum TaxID=1126234 RepID=A0ABD5R8P3_9EURY|nr:helix-turn-helix domain-containing protein [Salinirubrum litoreum]
MIEECLVVECRVTGDDCPLAAASREVGIRIECTPPQARADGNDLLHFSAPASDDLAATLDADDRIRYLHRSRGGRDGRGRHAVGGGESDPAGTDPTGRDDYRCLSKAPCVVHDLTNAGLVVESITYEDGAERYVGAVVGYDVLQGVLEAAGDTVGVTLERVYPLGPEEAGTPAGRWDVTPRQETAIRTALDMGYFAVPRETTASEVAEAIGISKSAFLERLRRGQAGLFRQVFG